jgi:hypothetical protein
MPLRNLVAAFLFSANGPSVVQSTEERTFIDSDSVERIEIAKRGEVSGPRRLGEAEAARFLSAWYEAKAIGLCKFAFEYRINAHLNSGRKVEFRTNGQTIKAENDFCFSVEQTRTFEELWVESESRQ